VEIVNENEDDDAALLLAQQFEMRERIKLPEDKPLHARLPEQYVRAQEVPTQIRLAHRKPFRCLLAGHAARQTDIQTGRVMYSRKLSNKKHGFTNGCYKIERSSGERG